MKNSFQQERIEYVIGWWWNWFMNIYWTFDSIWFCRALALDALANSHPIRQVSILNKFTSLRNNLSLVFASKTAQTPREINELFDPITYLYIHISFFDIFIFEKHFQISPSYSKGASIISQLANSQVCFHLIFVF